MEYLAHYGVKNMKWGVRRYQNEDGSYTPLGRAHYGIGEEGKIQKVKDKIAKNNEYLTGSKHANRKTQAMARQSRDLAKQNKAVSNYAKAMAGANRAILFKDFRKARADALGRKADRAQIVANRRLDEVSMLMQKEAQVRLRNAQLESKLERLTKKYIAKYGEDDYAYAFTSIDEWPVESEFSIKTGRWGIRNYQNSDGSLTPEGKVRYRVGEPEKSSGRYTTGSKDESSVRSMTEIASKDSKNWKQVSNKSGQREYEYVGPSGERAQAKAFRAADYTYAEIADMMGISESKVYDLLNK